MTKTKTTTPDPDRLHIALKEGDDPERATARILTGPFVTNAFALTRFGKGSIGDVKLDNVVAALTESAKAVNANNLDEIEDMLTSQAMVLNIMFGELVRKSALNMGDYLDAAQRFHNMALKAQNQCRMTLETLTAIKNPPVVYARQANIANGPQQVNNCTGPASRAEENHNPLNKQLETSNDHPLDTGTPGTPVEGHPAMETVGDVNRAKDS
jgi:hypothetical protein